MPKVTMSFDLPEESIDYYMANAGSDFHSVIFDLTARIRNKWKYDNNSECTWDIVWELLWDVYKDHNFDPYKEG
jgi:hypothetical protein